MRFSGKNFVPVTKRHYLPEGLLTSHNQVSSFKIADPIRNPFIIRVSI
jgi:hypothetical protein